MLMTGEVKWKRYKVFIIPFLKLSQKLEISQNKKPNDKKKVFLSTVQLVIYPPPDTSNRSKPTKPSKMTQAIITIHSTQRELPDTPSTGTLTDPGLTQRRFFLLQ